MEIQATIKFEGKTYHLNNNSDKFNRAAQEVGDSATPLEFLAAYDRLAGLIKDEDGNKIENGVFDAKYQKWKKEQPLYIKTLEDREQSLDEGEDRIITLLGKNIDHKRALLGTLMTIAAAIIAGLFIFASSSQNDGLFKLLALLSGIGYAVFIVATTYYLSSLLSQESEEGDERLTFVRDAKKDFIEKMNIGITDLDSYEKYRKEMYEKEKKLERKIRVAGEEWFKYIIRLFIASSLPLIAMFIAEACRGSNVS